MPSSRNINRTNRITYKGRNTQKASSISSPKSRLKRGASSRKRQKQVGGKAVRGAQNQLKRFRQGSILAVALTGFLLILLTPGEAGYTQESPESPEQEVIAQENPRPQDDLPDSVSIIENIAVEEIIRQQDTTSEVQVEGPEDISKAARDEAIGTLRRLWEGFYTNLPKILVAIATLFLAWLFIRLIRFILRKSIGHWHNSGAVTTLIVISIWMFAIGVAISVVAGDIRALVGSLGLVGLALSWSLQTPIESFTGWLLNSFRGYYRVGDRINVGEVFGDVYKIDFLTTTVWEIGAPYRQGFVQAEQPTGRLVTFPNNEILAGTVVNLTGDFPYVWDELAIAVANESDIKEAMRVLKMVADDFLGNYMIEPARQYHQILRKAGLHYQISEEPQIFISIGESWTDIIIRYLVGARERRKWKSELSLLIMEELNKQDYFDKIKSVYPRQQVQFITSDGKPADVKIMEKDTRNSKNEE